MACALKVGENEGREKKSRVRVGKGGMGSVYGPRDEKSKSRLFPEPEKGPRGRSWVSPHQGGLGRTAGEQGAEPASAGQRGLLSEPGLPQHLGARLEEGSQRYWGEWTRAWEGRWG